MNGLAIERVETSIQRLPLALLDAMKAARTLDELTIERLMLSIESHSLLQLPLVVPNAGRFSIAAGNHRCEALRRSGSTHVDCHVLPEGTPVEEALAISLHENNVRKNETFADLTRRVSALNEFHRCKTNGELAGIAGMSDSMLSKLKEALKILAPESIALAKELQVGWTVAYAVAKKATSPEAQLTMLRENAQGERTRSQIADESPKPNTAKVTAPRKPRAVKPKPLTIRRTEGPVRFGLQLPHEATHSVLIGAIASLLDHLEAHERSGEPLAAFH